MGMSPVSKQHPSEIFTYAWSPSGRPETPQKSLLSENRVLTPHFHQQPQAAVTFIWPHQAKLCHGWCAMGVVQSTYLRGKMQEVWNDAAFTLFLFCDVSMEVFGAHWDIGWWCPGTAELEFMGVQVTGCCYWAVEWPLESWEGKQVREGRPLVMTSYVWLGVLWAGSWAAVRGCMQGI